MEYLVSVNIIQEYNMIKQSSQPTRERQPIFQSGSDQFPAHITRVQSPQSQHRSHPHLSLSGMTLSTLHLSQFERVSQQLLSLDVSNCRLSEIPEVFTRMTSLLQINLSSNYIQVVDSRILQLRNLQVLLLHNNLIRKISVDFRKSVNLMSLDLRSNYLNEFPCISQTKLKQVNLLENLLQSCCNCVLNQSEVKTDWQNYVSLTEKKCSPVNLFEMWSKSNPKKEEVIVKACQNNHISVVQSLIQNHPKLMATFVKVQNQQHLDSLLAFAYKRARFRIFKILLDAGVIQKYSNFQDEFNNLLILTASNLDLENLNLLLNQGLFVYCKDSKGNSLLHVAFQQFDREEANARKICERLLKLGLDPNKLNSHNQSPLHLAVLYRFMPIIGLSLRKKKAIEFAINYNKGPGFPKFDFHLVDESDHTTLMHLATASGDPEIISLLYNQNLSLLDANSKNQNPKQVANTNVPVMKLIQKLEREEIRKHLLAEPKKMAQSVAMVKSKPLKAEDAQENEANLSDTSQDSQLLHIKNHNFQENLKEQQSKTKTKFIQSLKQSPEDSVIVNEDSEPFIEEMEEMIVLKELKYYEQDHKNYISIPNSCEKQSMRSINHKQSTSDIFERVLHSKNLKECLETFLTNIQEKSPHQIEFLILLFQIVQKKLSSHLLVFRNIHQPLITFLKQANLIQNNGDEYESHIAPDNREDLKKSIRKIEFFHQSRLDQQVLNYQLLTKHSEIRKLNPKELGEYRSKYHFKLNYDLTNRFANTEINEICSQSLKCLISIYQGLYRPVANRNKCFSNRMLIINFEDTQNQLPNKSRRRIFNNSIFFEETKVFHRPAALISPNNSLILANKYKSSSAILQQQANSFAFQSVGLDSSRHQGIKNK